MLRGQQGYRGHQGALRGVWVLGHWGLLRELGPLGGIGDVMVHWEAGSECRGHGPAGV